MERLGLIQLFDKLTVKPYKQRKCGLAMMYALSQWPISIFSVGTFGAYAEVLSL
jgi:hypothetical protein